VLVRPIGSPIEPTDQLDYVPVDVSPEAAVAAAWARRPEVRQVDLEEKIREHAVGIAKADMRPSLEFNGNFGWSTRKTRLLRASSSAGAGFVLTSVFDGLRGRQVASPGGQEQGRTGPDRSR
jgi:outer membrane protein TolC